MGILLRKAKEQLHINLDDDAPTRRKKLLNIVLILLMGTILILIGIYSIYVVLNGNYSLNMTDAAYALVMFIVTDAILLGTYIINNKVSSKPAIIITLVSIVVMTFITDSPANVVNGRSTNLFLVPIVLACLIAPPISSIVLALIITMSIAILGALIGVELNAVSITVNLLVAFIVWFLAYTLERSIRNVRQSQQNVTFYKDLFSHDINNILQNIKGTGDLINIFLQDGNMDKIQEFLSAINEQASRGASLVMNIRKIAEIEDNHVSSRSFDLIPVLQEIIQFTTSTFKRKKISIDFNPPEGSWLVDGHDILRNVFDNIIQNAIVHNEQELIAIEIRLSRELFPGDGRNAIKIEFLDNGIGIMPEIKERIFKPGMAKDRKTSGLGLGLSLVKNAITQLGGSISVTDRVEGSHENGSNFIIYLKEVKPAGG
jgi:signal transduction histidine kinase